MSLRTRRHLFLAVLGMLCLAGVLYLQGCASIYEWRMAGPSKPMQWVKTDQRTVTFFCPDSDRGIRNVGCAVTWGDKCTVYSVYSQAEAMSKFDPDGVTVLDHEARHCAGWVHQ